MDERENLTDREKNIEGQKKNKNLEIIKREGGKRIRVICNQSAPAFSFYPGAVRHMSFAHNSTHNLLSLFCFYFLIPIFFF